MKIKKLALCCLLCIIGNSYVHAQADRKNIRKGNKEFHAEQYVQAEVSYRKAISQNPRNAQAIYNLGNTLLAQQKDSAAIVQFENAGKLETNKLRKSKSYHNIGIICQKRQMYAEAIEAYKESLRNNPSDNETRYNLALCQRLLKNQPPKNNQQNQNKKNRDKDKQNNNNKQDKDKQDKSKKDSPNNQSMSKSNAEQLLNAAMQQEENTQQRLKKAMQQPKSKQLQKNW
uniref:Tetratricopeptide repeat protein n=4 Tax=unclassified Prevotella TaxID=2638335 RepID=A0AB33JKM1_9BACT